MFIEHLKKSISYQALVRWGSATEGFVSPGYFIPLCEENGMVIPLTKVVFEKVCQQIVIWLKQDLSRDRVAVNISALHCTFKKATLLSICNRSCVNIRLAKYQHIEVVAEGVEPENQAFLLHVMGCDAIQRFLFSQPIPSEKIPQLLAKESTKQIYHSIST
ncbi:MAG: EAL domain-containing protein (putative c-di-GMP-specific phosphodiesterase class I) [Alteromonadaceae bacterium]